jgi:GntR family phosphonate transport system transcriptional regulator
MTIHPHPSVPQEWLDSATLQRASGVPLWRQLEELLTRAIRDGRIKPGEQLPTEFSLAARFAVNRHTVRRALAALEAESLIRVERGHGTFVHENVIDYQLSRRTRFSENLRRQNREPSGLILDAGEMPAPHAVARALGLSDGEPTICIRHLSQADGRPISTATHYFPYKRFQGFLEIYRQRKSITATYAYFGVFDYTRKSTRVTARMPTLEEAELLKQPKNRPVLITESVNIDADGEPIEYGRTAFNGEVVQLVISAED